MPLTSTPTELVRVALTCECGRDMESTGLVLMSDPPIYEYHCPGCGRRETRRELYPRLEAKTERTQDAHLSELVATLRDITEDCRKDIWLTECEGCVSSRDCPYYIRLCELEAGERRSPATTNQSAQGE